MGLWRTIYYYMGWTYISKNDTYDKRQIHLKYLLTEQIKKSNVKKLLKCKDKEQGEIWKQRKYKKRKRNNSSNFKK